MILQEWHVRGPQPEDSSLPQPRVDPLSRGAPQLVGLYRAGAPESFGVSYAGSRYFQGLPLLDAVSCDGVEWRDEKFQRVDGSRLRFW